MSDAKKDSSSSEDLNLDLDFQLMPSWAKEQPEKNPYSDHPGETGGGRRDRRGRGNRDRGRGGGGGGGRGPGGPQGRRDSGRPGERRPGGPGGPGGAGGRQARGDRGSRSDRGPRRDGGPGQGSRDFRGGRDDRRGGGRGPDRRGPRDGGDRRGFRGGPVPKEEQPEAYGVKVNFLPQPNCVMGVVNQLRTTRTASSLFAIAKLFLAKPDRYLLRIKSLNPDKPFYQIGESGPVAFERSQLEFPAFEKCCEQFYEVKIEEQEEIKGNFTNVARCRLDGTLLGPTNHHAYQSKLRGLYEERYRGEMPFERFRNSIEVLNDEEAIEKWKTEARQEKIYKTRDEENPETLKGTSAARQHFALNHLNQVIRKTHTVTVTGLDSRSIPDADLQKAMRSAYEMEIRFPNRLAQALRGEFVKSGLHVFKHRKRMLYAWSFRPRKLRRGDQTLAPMVEEILKIVEAHPGLNRHELAAKIIPELDQDKPAPKPQQKAEPREAESAPETVEPGEKPAEPAESAKGEATPAETQPAAEAEKTAGAPGNVEEKKNELAGYLHWLIGEGFVIEFQDGKLEFPIEPKPGDRKGRGGKKSPRKDQAKGEKQQQSEQVKTASATQEKSQTETAEQSSGSATTEEITEAPGKNSEEPRKQPDNPEPESKPEAEAGAAPQATAAPELKPQDSASEPAPTATPAESAPEPEPAAKAEPEAQPAAKEPEKAAEPEAKSEEVSKAVEEEKSPGSP